MSDSKSPNFKVPPPRWIHRFESGSMTVRSDDAIMRIWNDLTQTQRLSAWNCERLMQRRLAAAHQRIASGRGTPHDKGLVQGGGYSRARIGCRPRQVLLRSNGGEEREEQKRKRYNNRRSKRLLEFQLQHARGCAHPGCTLAPVDGVESMMPFLLFEHDHIDPALKEGDVSRLSGAAKEAELEKTVCMCAWHHFLRTRDQRSSWGDRINRSPLGCKMETHARTEIDAIKERVGCQHPCHGLMPYASMIPSLDTDPRAIGFFHVSHVRLDHPRPKQTTRHRDHLADLRSGAAVVHCKSCHQVWTTCENARLYDTPLSQHQDALVRRRFPAFVQHFDMQTAGFDWRAQRATINDRRNQARHVPLTFQQLQQQQKHSHCAHTDHSEEKKEEAGER